MNIISTADAVIGIKRKERNLCKNTAYCRADTSGLSAWYFYGCWPVLGCQRQKEKPLMWIHQNLGLKEWFLMMEVSGSGITMTSIYRSLKKSQIM